MLGIDLNSRVEGEIVSVVLANVLKVGAFGRKVFVVLVGRKTNGAGIVGSEVGCLEHIACAE